MKDIPAPIIGLLNAEAARINSKAFIVDDPVRFPHRFTDLRDIELSAFLAASIAWGRRPMIIRDGEKLMEMMRGEPYIFVREGAFEELDPARNVHRTLFVAQLQHFLRGLRRIYSRFSSLDAFAASCGAPASDAPAWTLVEAMQREMTAANDGVKCSRCLPVNSATSALKRVNMALRWLVRRDGIVDLGVWESIRPSQLFIPLDVHVGNTSRELGLLTRKSNDRKAVEELTACLRMLRPDDPAYYDFALFGIGIGVQTAKDDAD